MLARLFLVRHGEVRNPDHLCYGRLPGFVLSETGRRQARAAADYLAPSGADLLLCSPLARAEETAALIGRRLGLAPVVDPRLTEWELAVRWEGVRWEDLPDRFPGELPAYLDHPADLPFSPESLAAAAERMAAVVDEWGRARPGGQAIIVSHQDPIQAVCLLLTGGRLQDLQVAKPGHGSVLTLDPGPEWRLAATWSPPGATLPSPPATPR